MTGLTTPMNESGMNFTQRIAKLHQPNSDGTCNFLEKGRTVTSDVSYRQLKQVAEKTSLILWSHNKSVWVVTLARQHTLPLGHHTLGIECMGVLSTGLGRMLVGNRVSVGLTLSTVKSFAPI